MGFRFFRREKEREVTPEELRAILEEEIEAHRSEVEKFAEENFLALKKAVSALVSEIESFQIELLPNRLRGVTKNFVSMIGKQWQIGHLKEEKPVDFFEEVSSRAAKLALSMKKAYRILFAVKLPEMEAINQKIKDITSLISAYEELKNDPEVLRKREVLDKMDELKRVENMIEKTAEKIKNLEKADVEVEEVGEETSAEFRMREEELKRKISALEADLQKKLGIIRKPLRIYTHMVGEKLELANYRELGKKDLQKLVERAKSEIVKGSVEVKESQKEGIIKSLDFIAKGEAARIILEIDSLRKELSSLQARIKTIESKKRAKAAGKKQRIKKELSSLENQMEGYLQKKERLREEIKRLIESMPYRLTD